MYMVTQNSSAVVIKPCSAEHGGSADDFQ